MRKILGIASLIMSTGVVHAEQINEQEQISPYSANVTFASQYISRGFQQTWGKPALQIGLDYANPNGLFVGTWASNVSSNYLRDASVEWDFYTGYIKTFDKFSAGMTVFITTIRELKVRLKRGIQAITMAKLCLKLVMGL